LRRVDDETLVAPHAADLLLSVSVVVIGMNEARHLPACFASIASSRVSPCEVIYVDSGSTDASCELAELFGADLLVSQGSRASAAAARNAGLARVRGDVVHFVDGDMSMDGDWLQAALAALAADNLLACVFGRVDELGTSLADRIIGRDWSNRRPGLALAPGSGGTFRTRVLRQVGGYPEDLVAGEETELGRRLRAGGYRIRCLPATMGGHELGISSVKAYWARGMRAGLARWQLAGMRALTPVEWVNLVKPFVFTGGAVATLALTLSSGRSRLLGLLGMVTATALVTRLTVRAARDGDSISTAVAAALENYVRCLPITIGFAAAGARSVGLACDRGSRSPKLTCKG
jgi:hypothetical protein